MELLRFPVKDDDFRDLVEWACDLEDGPWVAGGSVRKVWQGLPWDSGDVDFFFRDREQFDRIVSILPALGDHHKVIYDSGNAVTFRVTLHSGRSVKIQAIRKTWHASHMALLQGFDFNLSQFASDGVTILTTAASVEDIESNRLRATSTRDTPIHPLRVLKYAAYGFDPDPRLLMRAAANITADDLANQDY